MSRESHSHLRAGKIIAKDDYSENYMLNIDGGTGEVQILTPFQGIEFALININGACMRPRIIENPNILEINYCQKGRMECMMKDGCLQYIGEGDLFMTMENNHSDEINFPLGYYAGAAVIINLDQAPDNFDVWLPGVDIHIAEILSKFFEKDDCFFIQANEKTAGIFNGILTMNPEEKYAYSRLKALELLLYLKYFDTNKEVPKNTYMRAQAETIKQVRKFLVSNLEKRYTIEALSKQFCVSPTMLKTYFKGIYGQPISTYMKEYRMNHAAKELRTTTKSIAEIAKDTGYESQSKFGKAFKDQMGVTPFEYRNKGR